MANRYRGTIYVGMTGALYNRVIAHRADTFAGFTKKYGLKKARKAPQYSKR